jgi:UDP-N-acetylglucosamine:LPS N-acetylglucosamine transferase
VIVDDASLDGNVLRARVADLRAAPARLQGMRDGMLSSARPDAAGAVARELLRLAERRR